MRRKEKEAVVSKISTALKGSTALFLTDFQGLKVSEMSDLRRKVGEAGGRYTVVKNTLLKLAVKGTDSEVISELLVGNNGLGTAKGDPVPLAKALMDFAKKNDKLAIKAGLMSGRLLTSDDVRSLSVLPSREVLLAKMLGTMNAVPGNFVRLLAAVTLNFLYALAAVRDQKEGQAG
ncbi:MAG: 50S ribosomal protein L10 [Pseudomonadota bacterium]